MNVSRLSFVAVALTAFVAIAGCNSGKRSGKPNFGPGSGGGGGGGGGGGVPSLGVTGVQNQDTALLGTTINALILSLQNTGASAASVNSITVTAAGSVDESTVITTAALVNDANTNGVADIGETQLATAAQPAFSGNNGNVVFTLNPPLAIPANSTVQLIVTVNTVAITGNANQVPIVGQTVRLVINSAADIAVAGITPTGTFPINGTACTLGIGTHLLITEIFYDPGGPAEFIEIFNPTPSTIQLANYHITDYTQQVIPPAQPSRFYYLLTTYTQKVATGQFGPVNPIDANEPDFSVRFPSNASISPGDFQIIAIDGTPNNGFATQFPNVTPDYALRGATNPTVSMLVWNPTVGQFQPGDVGTAVGLTHANGDGEQIFLFTWDGSANPPSDLVTDVDIVGWGVETATTGSLNNYMISKTSVAVDGIDAGGQTTAYAADTDLTTQRNARPATGPQGQSLQRTSYNEANEAKTNGNGVGGHDETSENWSQNFVHGAPTPGTR